MIPTQNPFSYSKMQQQQKSPYQNVQEKRQAVPQHRRMVSEDNQVLLVTQSGSTIESGRYSQHTDTKSLQPIHLLQSQQSQQQAIGNGQKNIGLYQYGGRQNQGYNPTAESNASLISAADGFRFDHTMSYTNIDNEQTMKKQVYQNQYENIKNSSINQPNDSFQSQRKNLQNKRGSVKSLGGNPSVNQMDLNGATAGRGALMALGSALSSQDSRRNLGQTSNILQPLNLNNKNIIHQHNSSNYIERSSEQIGHQRKLKHDQKSFGNISIIQKDSSSANNNTYYQNSSKPPQAFQPDIFLEKRKNSIQSFNQKVQQNTSSISQIKLAENQQIVLQPIKIHNQIKTSSGQGAMSQNHQQRTINHNLGSTNKFVKSNGSKYNLPQTSHTRDNSMDALNKKDRFLNRIPPAIPSMETQNLYPNVNVPDGSKSHQNSYQGSEHKFQEPSDQFSVKQGRAEKYRQIIASHKSHNVSRGARSNKSELKKKFEQIPQVSNVSVEKAYQYQRDREHISSQPLQQSNSENWRLHVSLIGPGNQSKNSYVHRDAKSSGSMGMNLNNRRLNAFDPTQDSISKQSDFHYQFQSQSMQPQTVTKQPTSASDSRFNKNLIEQDDQKVHLNYQQRSRGNYDVMDESNVLSSLYVQEPNKRQHNKQSVIKKIPLLSHKKSVGNTNISSDHNYDYYENRNIGGSVQQNSKRMGVRDLHSRQRNSEMRDNAIKLNPHFYSIFNGNDRNSSKSLGQIQSQGHSIAETPDTNFNGQMRLEGLMGKDQGDNNLQFDSISRNLMENDLTNEISNDGSLLLENSFNQPNQHSVMSNKTKIPSQFQYDISSNVHQKQIQIRHPQSTSLARRVNKRIIRPNAKNMASKHFPQDFFNQQNKEKMRMGQMAQNNNYSNTDNSMDDVSQRKGIESSCCYNDTFQNFYNMNDASNTKNSLTIDYEGKQSNMASKIELEMSEPNQFLLNQQNINQKSIETFSDIVSKQNKMNLNQSMKKDAVDRKHPQHASSQVAYSDNDMVSIHSNSNNTRNIVNLLNNDSAESKDMMMGGLQGKAPHTRSEHGPPSQLQSIQQSTKISQPKKLRSNESQNIFANLKNSDQGISEIPEGKNYNQKNVLAGSRSMQNYQKTLEIDEKSKATQLLQKGTFRDNRQENHDYQHYGDVKSNIQEGPTTSKILQVKHRKLLNQSSSKISIRQDASKKSSVQAGQLADSRSKKLQVEQQLKEQNKVIEKRQRNEVIQSQICPKNITQKIKSSTEQQASKMKDKIKTLEGVSSKNDHDCNFNKSAEDNNQQYQQFLGQSTINDNNGEEELSSAYASPGIKETTDSKQYIVTATFGGDQKFLPSQHQQLNMNFLENQNQQSQVNSQKRQMTSRILSFRNAEEQKLQERAEKVINKNAKSQQHEDQERIKNTKKNRQNINTYQMNSPKDNSQYNLDLRKIQMKRNSVAPLGSKESLSPFDDSNHQQNKILTEASPTVDRSNLNACSEFGDQTSNTGQHGKVTQKQTIVDSASQSPKNSRRMANILQKVSNNQDHDSKQTKLQLKNTLTVPPTQSGEITVNSNIDYLTNESNQNKNIMFRSMQKNKTPSTEMPGNMQYIEIQNQSSTFEMKSQMTDINLLNSNPTRPNVQISDIKS